MDILLKYQRNSALKYKNNISIHYTHTLFLKDLSQKKVVKIGITHSSIQSSYIPVIDEETGFRRMKYSQTVGYFCVAQCL